MSQGPLDSAIARNQLVAPLTVPFAAQTNVDPTTGATVATFVCPHTAQVKGIGVAYPSATGTAPNVTASLRRSTTKLASVSTTGDTTAGGTARSAASAYVQQGEALNIFLDGTNNADNDFAAGFVIVEMQLVVDPDAA